MKLQADLVQHMRETPYRYKGREHLPVYHRHLAHRSSQWLSLILCVSQRGGGGRGRRVERGGEGQNQQYRHVETLKDCNMAKHMPKGQKVNTNNDQSARTSPKNEAINPKQQNQDQRNKQSVHKDKKPANTFFRVFQEPVLLLCFFFPLWFLYHGWEPLLPRVGCVRCAGVRHPAHHNP